MKTANRTEGSGLYGEMAIVGRLKNHGIRKFETTIQESYQTGGLIYTDGICSQLEIHRL